MKVIITGGCGGMGRFLVRAVSRLKNIESITIADLIEPSAKEFARDFDHRFSGIGLDVSDSEAMAEIFKHHDIVLNTTGPFFRFGKPVLEAALSSNCHYMDICDDWEPTEEMLRLDGEAKSKNLTAVVGLGASPGLTNLLALLAMNQLDEVEKVYTGWDLTAATPEDESSQEGTNAAMEHGIEQMIGKVKIFRNGIFEMVRPLEKVYINYPGKKGSNAYIFGHPEAITFAHHYPEIKASVNLCHGIEKSVSILKFIRALVEWRIISKNQAARILNWLEGKVFQSAGIGDSEELPSVYGLAFGTKEGQPASVGCTLSSSSSSELSMGEATAYPLACGLKMFLNREITRAGVFAPESGAIDPSTFLGNFLGLFEEPSNKHSFDASDLIVLDRSWG